MKKITLLLFAMLLSVIGYSQGVNCGDPIVIGALPYSTTDNTSAYGDDYDNGSSPCSSFYMSGDDVFYTYTPAANIVVDITLSGLSGTYSGIHVLDACVDATPTCVAFAGNSSTADRVLDDVALTGGVTYFIAISTWAAPQSTAYTLDIVESLCVSPAATTTLVEDCANSQFTVDVDITNLGDASSVSISNDAGVAATTGITAIGVQSVGPFPAGTEVNLVLEHDGFPVCNVDLGAVLDNCPAQFNVDCAAGTPVNVTYCYDNGEDRLWQFTSSDGSALRVDFVEGYFEDCCDDIIIYDGIGTMGTVLFMSDTDFNNDATGISAISTSDSMTVRLTSDGSVSCASGSGSPALNFNVTCNTCTPATVTAAVVDDCAGSGGFNIVVDVTDLGSSTSLTLSDDQGSMNQTANAIGMYTFGPYVNGTTVAITSASDQDAACTEMFSGLIQEACPPANDECAGAIALEVNADLACGIVTAGTTLGATASPQPDDATGTPNTDVWFTFVATASNNNIVISNVVNQGGGTSTSTDMGMSVFDDLAGCNMVAANEVGESDPNTLQLSGLTSGNTYYVRVYGWGTTIQYNNFDICVGTPPPPPANDDCVDAEALTFGTTCVNVETSTTSATEGANELNSCDGFGNLGVWYTITAPASGQIDFTSGTGSPGIVLYEGPDCATLTEVAGTCFNNASGSITGLTPSNTYYAMVWTDSAQATVDFCLVEVVPAPANDDCATAEALTLGTMVSGDTTNATDSGIAAGSCGATGGDQDVWYSFTATATGQVDIDTTADTVVVYDACGGNEVACVGEGMTNVMGLTDGTTYYARVYNTGIAKLAGPIELTVSEATLSTTDFDNSSIFSYYPNPVNNTLTLKAQNEISNVTVFNMLGQEVIRTAPNTVSNELDMSNLQSGAYFVQVTVGQATQTVRIIKN